MSTIKIFAKSAVDLHSSMTGAYAYILDDFKDQLRYEAIFKVKVKTLTQADCMAYVNALDKLSKTAAADEVQTLEIITDSKKVIDLLEIYKFEKHCAEIEAYWREKVKPRFVNLQRFKMIKLDRKMLIGDLNCENLARCQVRAEGELHKQMELVK